MTNERMGWRALPGFLMRLRRDTRGNALMLIAAAVIPMAALAGSAIDMARFYVVKVRLQQACDAGVLAGRKFMDPNNAGATLDDNATQQAKKFFKGNFTQGWFGTSAVNFTPAKTTDSQVSGVASAVVPLTVMQMFGFQPVTLNVACKARYDVADADIMFVLDTTGSMGCTAADVEAVCTGYAVSTQQKNADGSYSVVEKPSSRISAVRNAVLLFYDTVTASADPTTHFRYGFVPYTATANVGYLLTALNPSYVADSVTYQSRVFTFQNNGNSTTNNYTNKTQAECNAYQSQPPYTAGTVGGVAQYVTTKTTSTWTKSGQGNGNCSVVAQPMKAAITYQQTPNIATNIYKTGSGTVVNPADVNGAYALAWPGCVEERSTTPNTTSFNSTNPPADLAVDISPSDLTTDKWKPLWLDMEFWRNNATSESDSSPTRTYAYRSGNTAWYLNDIPCPRKAQRLKTMTRDEVSTYVNAPDFRPFGVTYHDVGMTWGTRLIVPNGLFGADTTAWPGRQAPNRFIIFLTDGDMQTSTTAYAAHGMEVLDKRVVGSGAMNTDNLDALHNARFSTGCTIAKNHNIKVFVIAYAAALDASMTACASPGGAYAAPTDAKLTQVFQTIAQQVAMLRIDQ